MTADRPEPTLSSPTVVANAAPTVSSGRTSGPVGAVASEIAERRGATSGYRTLVTWSERTSHADATALDLAGQLSGHGQSVLIVDWSLAGRSSVSASTGAPSPGMTELLCNSASFEDVIRQVPGTSLQIIAPGAAADDVDTLLDPSRLNLVLDALDEAYDQIVIAAAHDDARLLFKAIEGRVDAGVRVSQSGQQAPEGNFLGYDVEDIRLFDVHTADTKPVNRPSNNKKPATLLRA